jgi:hypothetical protein
MLYLANLTSKNKRRAVRRVDPPEQNLSGGIERFRLSDSKGGVQPCLTLPRLQKNGARLLDGSYMSSPAFFMSGSQHSQPLTSQIVSMIRP